MLETEQQVSQQQLEECAEYFNKCKTLQYALKTDLLSCDAKWTLFVSAAFSYRYDSVLQPYPPHFATEQSQFDIDSLIAVIKDTPKLSVVLHNLMADNAYDGPSSEVVHLLYWVLVVMSEPALRLLEGEEVDCLLSAIDEKHMQIKPTHIFEVNDSREIVSDEIFYGKTAKLPLKFAFMGSKLDNYFSMLQNVCAPNLELTTDLQTSLQNSPYCAAWGASQCGSIISCVAVCEFAINDEEDRIVPNKNDKSCIDIVLCNPENIRLRYLMFYGRRFSKTNGIFSWISNYKFYLYFLSYIVFMTTFGLFNSDSGRIVKDDVSKKIELVLSFFRRIVGAH